MSAVTLQAELKALSMPVDRATFGPGTVLASFAEQSRTTFRGTAGRVSVILSPPEPLLQKEPAEVLDITVRDAERLGVKLRNSVSRYKVVSRTSDFYSLAPGNDALRPGQRTPVAGLTLAGDYTRQPYLATMEGATYSGRLAAEAVQEYLGAADRVRSAGPASGSSQPLVPQP